jgi:RHS repeat-associated protein
VLELTDSSGAVQAEESYDSYGRVTKLGGSLNSEILYTGFYFHATSGLSIARHRFYNSNRGRWLNRDPIEETGGTNLYAYVLNSPVVSIDPSGTQGVGIGWWGWAAAGAAGALAYYYAQWWKYWHHCMSSNSGNNQSKPKGSGDGDNSGGTGSGSGGSGGPGSSAPVPPTTPRQLKNDPNTRLIQRGKSNQFGRPGSWQEALDEFWSLRPYNVKVINTEYGNGFAGQLPGGGTVSVRPGSSGGAPTLQINEPNTPLDKFRYGPGVL